MRTPLKTITCVVLLAFGLTLAYARPSSSRSRSSHSSHSSHSSSRPSRSYSPPSRPAPKVSSPSSSKKGYGQSSTYSKTSSSSGWGSSSNSYTGASRSKVDRALTTKTNQIDTSTGMSRSQAIVDRDPPAPRPRPSAPTAATSRPQPTPQAAPSPSSTTYSNRTYRYATEPAYWPTYIPRRHYWRNRDYVVIYDRSYGGYGWYEPSGTWVYYDTALNDPAGATAPTGTPGSIAPQPQTSSGIGTMLKFLLGLVLGVGLLLLFWSLWKTFSSKEAAAQEPKLDKPYSPPPPPKSNNFVTGLTGRSDLTGVKKGDVIRLSDALSVKDAKELDPEADHLKATVDSVLRVREKNGLGTYTFIYATSEKDEQALLIKVKDVDSERGIACYTLEREGTRKDFLNADYQWLFSKPKTQPFDVMELRYTNEFRQDLAGIDSLDHYQMVHRSELHGVGTYAPARSGVRDVLTTIAEYHTESPTEATEYLVLETGNGRTSHSQVETWWGSPLKASEIRC